MRLTLPTDGGVLCEFAPSPGGRSMFRWLSRSARPKASRPGCKYFRPRLKARHASRKIA